jgi:AcrR family transcriptional regulator
MSSERQREIMEASLEIISAEGIQNLTIKNISGKIGISEPAIYRHYENKISILVAILDEFRAMSGKLFSDHSAGDTSPVEKLKNIFKGLFKAFEKNPSMVSVIFSEEVFRNEPLLRQRISEIMEHNSSVIRTLVAEGQKSGDIDGDIDPGYLTIILTGSLRMLVRKWQEGDKQFNQAEEVENLFGAIARMIAVK